MTRKLFGTDGVRGKANQWPMTPDLILSLAMAAGRVLRRGDHHHTVVIGKDTRLSGYMIESTLTAGFLATGMDVVLLGPLPTPAVAMLTRSLRADLGVMISGSHNPYEDNGIKLFNAQGNKLSDAMEAQIEAQLHEPAILVSPATLGKTRRLDDAAGRYCEFVKATLPRDFRLDGLKIVVDCAHGAAYKVSPQILWELGADVISLGTTPDGMNINEGCGSLDVTLAQRAVLENNADLGIILDGDADRLIMVDATGGILDGDHLLALIATSWLKTGQLKAPLVVATQMSNLGLQRYLASLGIDMLRTVVGDRYVLAAMQASGAAIGGEPSGHIILNDFTTTGDGLMAALQVLRAVYDVLGGRIRPLFTPVPQLLKSVYVETFTTLTHDDVTKAIRQGEERLSTAGRLLVRRSGTEPLVRIMAEGEDMPTLEGIVGDVIAALKEADQSASRVA